MLNFYGEDGQRAIRNTMTDALEIICEQRTKLKSYEELMDYYRKEIGKLEAKVDELTTKREEVEKEAQA